MQTDYGLDTSRWQGQITQADSDAAKAAGKLFWYFKGSGGDDGCYVDSQFQNTLNLLRFNAWRNGVYHFSGLTDAPTEANYAVDNVWNQLQTGEVAILDIDSYSTADVAWTVDFLQVAIPRLGFKLVLYMNQNTENSLDWSPVVAMGVGLIISNYAVAPDGSVGLKNWPFYLGQQYSSGGSIGSLNPVDLDAIFVNDISVWDAYGKPAPVPIPVVTTTTTESTTTTSMTSSTTTTTSSSSTTTTLPSPNTQPVIINQPICNKPLTSPKPPGEVVVGLVPKDEVTLAYSIVKYIINFIKRIIGV